MPKPILPPELAAELAPATLLVRGGSERSAYDETSEALFLTSGFVYGSAAEAEAAFKQDGSRYVYSRYRNPTVTMFEERLRLIEGAEACRATASGMAAVFAALLCKLRAGQRVVASRALFGSCYYIVAESAAALRSRDRTGRRARSLGLGGGAGCRRGGGVLRKPVEPGDGDHRPRRGRAADPSRRRHPGRGQRLRDAAVAEAAGARRRCRRLFGDQAHRRAGPRARRRDPGQREIHQGRSRPVLPPHRAVAEPVQRLAVAEGAGDAGTARRAAMPHRRWRSRAFWKPIRRSRASSIPACRAIRNTSWHAAR